MTSLTQRREILSLVGDAVRAGARQSRACEVVGLSTRTLQRWQRDTQRGDRRPERIQRPHNRLGELERQRESRPMGGYRRSRIAHKETQIRQWIEATPDLTLAELSQRLAEEGIQIKVPALWHQLNKWGLSFKKNPARQRAAARRRASGTPQVDR